MILFFFCFKKILRGIVFNHQKDEKWYDQKMSSGVVATIFWVTMQDCFVGLEIEVATAFTTAFGKRLTLTQKLKINDIEGGVCLRMNTLDNAWPVDDFVVIIFVFRRPIQIYFLKIVFLSSVCVELFLYNYGETAEQIGNFSITEDASKSFNHRVQFLLLFSFFSLFWWIIFIKYSISHFSFTVFARKQPLPPESRGGGGWWYFFLVTSVSFFFFTCTYDAIVFYENWLFKVLKMVIKVTYLFPDITQNIFGK